MKYKISIETKQYAVFFLSYGIFKCLVDVVCRLHTVVYSLLGWTTRGSTSYTRFPYVWLTTSSGFLPALCDRWSGFFYVHRVWLSYTRDRRLRVSSERLGNEDKAPCQKGATAVAGFELMRNLQYGSSRSIHLRLDRSATTAPQNTQ